MATIARRLSATSVMPRAKLIVVITGINTLKVRLWIGTKLIVLAARFMGCGIEITTEASDGGSSGSEEQPTAP